MTVTENRPAPSAAAQPQADAYDPVTIEIIQNALQAIADEMFIAMKRTAMSSIIYEVLDMGTGVLDADGELASSGAGIPAFVGVLDKSCKVLLQKFDDADIHEGDVFLVNDPYFGGITHLNDMVLLMPVFCEGKRIAWTANIAHNSDVGGMAAGSISGDATEIFQEGLRIPMIKVINRGVTDEQIFEILKLNSRMPEALEGDIWAAIAAVRVGDRRLRELAVKYGVDTFLEAVRRFMTYGYDVAKAALAKLPKGTFERSEEQDDGSIFHVKVTITDDEFVVDLSNNPDQSASPLNTCRDSMMVPAQMIFKSLTSPDSPANGGSFRPIRLITKPGTLFDAIAPAPQGIYYELELRIYDLLWRCLAEVVPEQLGAGHFASVCGTFIGGIHPDTGRQYTIIEPQIGGWGATRERDGVSAMFCGFHGETYNCPAEINEARNGLYIEKMALNTIDPGGEGAHCGGRGIVLEYRVRSDNGYLTMGYTRSKFGPWAVDGGREGSSNYCEVISAADGTTERYSFVSGLPTKAGDVIRIVTANGGGLGDPSQRDPELVRADLKNELISVEQARDVFGVTV